MGSAKRKSNPFNMFDGICVINMDKDIDRWMSFRKEAEKMGIMDRVVRISGVYNSVGSYGCALAHKKVIQYAKDKGWDNVLVLEDDIKFIYSRDRVERVVKEAWDRLPQYWKILYLGINIKPGQTPVKGIKSNPFIDPALKYWGEFAMVINSNAYDFLLNTVPDNLSDFKPELRGDMVNSTIDHSYKFIVNPCVTSVHPFITQTGVGLQKVGNYVDKGGDAQLHKEYLRHGFTDDDTEDHLTIMVKTFKRPLSLERFIASVRINYPRVKIIVADDSSEAIHSVIKREDYPDSNVEYWLLPFDTGVTCGKNFMIDKVETKYALLCDDDFVFTEQTNLACMLELIQTSDADILGGGVTGKSSCNYSYLLHQVNDKLYYTKGHHKQDRKGLCYVDIIPNFFIADTKELKRVRWDDKLKVIDHSAFFYNCKFNGLKVAYTNSFSIDHDHTFERSAEYSAFRGRKEDLNVIEASTGVVEFIRHTPIPPVKVSNFTDPVYLSYGMNNLREMVGILNRYNKKYWVSNGTLLGIHREDRFIPHDTDIDIQIPRGEMDLELVQTIISKGFLLVHMIGTYDEGFELSFAKNGVKIDLFTIYPHTEGKIKMGIWGYGKRLDLAYDDFDIERRVWHNIPLYIPIGIEKILVAEYGPKWNVSDGGINWHWLWSRHNIVIPSDFKGDKEAYRKYYMGLPGRPGVRTTDLNTVINYLKGPDIR